MRVRVRQTSKRYGSVEMENDSYDRTKKHRSMMGCERMTRNRGINSRLIFQKIVAADVPLYCFS